MIFIINQFQTIQSLHLWKKILWINIIFLFFKKIPLIIMILAFSNRNQFCKIMNPCLGLYQEVREPCVLSYLHASEQRRDGFLPFWKAFVWNKNKQPCLECEFGLLSPFPIAITIITCKSLKLMCDNVCTLIYCREAVVMNQI